MTSERNIVLCGFMGCGKTTLGPLIADFLGREYADTDFIVERGAGMRIPEIFRRLGEDAFRDMEHAAVVELASRRGIVYSTGGGAPVSARNVEPLRASGLLIYLNPGFDECYERVRDSDRPLVRGMSRERLAELYAEREPLYRAACSLELTASGLPQDWLEAALSLLGAYS